MTLPPRVSARTLVATSILLLWAVAGCSSSEGGEPAGDAGGTTEGGATDGGTPDASAGADAAVPCEAAHVERIEGTAVDEAGEPVEGARPQACIRVAPDGHLICLEPPMAAADGAFTIEVPEDNRCVEELALRLLLPGSEFATTYCEVEVDPEGGVLTLDEPTVLYATEPPTTLPPLGDEAAARTVVFSDGLELEVTPSELGFGVEYDQLAARRVPVDPAPCFATDTAGLEGLYAFRPEGPVEGDGFPLRIPNTTGLAPGTTVELLVLGGLETRLPDGTLVQEADFVPFGTATVDDAGEHIESDEGVGLPYFTWLGYRLIP